MSDALPQSTPTLAVQVQTLHELGLGAIAIARRLDVPQADVLAAADAVGIILRRRGLPPAQGGPRIHRVTIGLTASEWADVVAAASDVGTVSPPEWAREAVVAAARGER